MVEESRLPGGAVPDAATTDDLEELAELDVDWQIELKPDGRLLSTSPLVQDFLQSRLRRAELLPTGPEWAVLRSIEPTEPASDVGAPREVVCCGALGEQSISLIDFMGFLATGYQTGVLTVASAEAQRSVYVHQGDVVWASSSAAEDRLGEFLLRRGKITREQLQTAMRRGGTRLGRACVECGFLAAHELWSMVQAQLTEIFDQILRTERGVWSFSRISSEALAESRIHLSTQGLLMDALRRLDEMKVFRQKIRSAHALVRRASRPADRDTADLLSQLRDVDADEAANLLKLLPRSATIHELMRYLGRGEFEVTRLVHHLIRAGVVELENPEPAAVAPRRADQVAQTQARDVVQVYSMAIREMFTALENKRRPTQPILDAASAYLRASPSASSPVLSAVRIQRDGMLEEAPLLAVTANDAVPVQKLSDHLSELMFFILFQATELLGRADGDVLARRVKTILELLSSDQS